MDGDGRKREFSGGRPVRAGHVASVIQSDLRVALCFVHEHGGAGSASLLDLQPISFAQSGIDSFIELDSSAQSGAHSPENLEGSARLNDSGQLARAVDALQPGHFGNPPKISWRA